MTFERSLTYAAGRDDADTLARFRHQFAHPVSEAGDPLVYLCGHSLGLQTHDVGCASRAPRPDNPFLRNTTDVATNQVFTIEPGVYLIADLLEPLRAGPQGAGVDWTLVDALAPLGGVRIEDNILVTPDGCEVLSADVTNEF